MAALTYVSSLVSKAIEAKGWGVHQFAKEAGIAVTTAYRWVRGQSTPDPATWPELEALLGLSDGAFLQAKQADIAAEYKMTQDKRRELLKGAAERFNSQRTDFDTFRAFYAYYLDNDFSIAIIAELLEVPVETVTQWVLESTPPPKEHWATIEAHYNLPKGTLQRTADKEASSRTTVDPDKIAAHGTLKDEDRPAIAQLLQQVLDQQAQIVKRLDQLDQDK